ncbi:hypothetical protein [Encephalitozoon cuniculi GB-M1]|uniref:Tetratricopeptide repeat protein n=2 Tax=Encephalitozoon cuniculi TaxID=6035 RepID=Q8SUL2_ENCCU|nr:uncharacterized protein ECU08_1590 [Encephalitozoon cuniculi GB-M1]AGE95061.1 hypothetical protein ECU08_1590 [Encephalitozoon cuniculi]KMV65686.1 hypothetical protein M970_081610 [Encephalitozoon cuniculi EcunIII-L]UYI27092.1 hypothetical protein J0A71_04g09420 [Encephalitozoon cuniculi]CAD26463.1 hypothetical protein [Encephalitozoon cuniculi GB-M1]
MEEVEKEIVRKIDQLLYEEALKLIDLTPLTPGSGVTIYPYKGHILHLQKKYDESIDFLRSLIRRFPPNIKAKRFLYSGLLAQGDFRSSFRVAKECWIDGDYRRSTLVRILAHALVLRDLSFLDLLDAHCNEPLLLSVGYIYSGRLERAVELMRGVDDSNGALVYLDALIAVRTGSVYMLDYIRYLDEDVFVAAIDGLEKKLRVFEGVKSHGCEYVDSKVLSIAKKVLNKSEYETIVRSVSSRKGLGHRCERGCLVGKLRIGTEEDIFLKEGNFCSPAGRYSELEDVFNELENGNYSSALENLKRMYRVETTTDLGKHLKDGQNTLVLDEIRKSYSNRGRREDASRYAELLEIAHSFRVRDVIECLSGLIDENMIREIIELLELDLFTKEA